MTSKSPVGDISVVTLIRTDTTLDHSQKAEKVKNHVKEESKNRVHKKDQDESLVESAQAESLRPPGPGSLGLAGGSFWQAGSRAAQAGWR